MLIVLGHLNKIKIIDQDTMDLLTKTLKIYQETSHIHTKIIAIKGQDMFLTHSQTSLVLGRIPNYSVKYVAKLVILLSSVGIGMILTINL